MAKSSTSKVIWEGESYDVHFVVGEIPKGGQMDASRLITEFRQSTETPDEDLNRKQQDELLRKLDILVTLKATRGIHIIQKSNGEKFNVGDIPEVVLMSEDSPYTLQCPPTEDMLEALPLSVVEEWQTAASQANLPFIKWLFPSRTVKPVTSGIGITPERE